jgi:hypothetical protein
MADSTLYYTLDDYRSKQVAKAVKAFFDAEAEVKQANNLLQLTEENEVLATAMGATTTDVGLMKSNLAGVVAAMVNWDFGMSRMDKGL